MKMIKLADALSIANLVCLIVLISLYATSIKPEEVLRAVESQNILLTKRSDSNAAGIAALKESQAGLLGELNTLQKTLNSLYQAMVTLIDSRGDTRYHQEDAATDWQEYQQLNPGVSIPERFKPK